MSSTGVQRGAVAATAVTALAPISWGTTYLVTTELLPVDRPLFNGVARALPAGLLLVAATRVLPPRGCRLRVAVLGTLYIGVFFPLLFVSASRLPGGVAALLGAAGPLVTLGLARLMVGERATARKVVAGVCGVAGVGLVVLSSSARLDTLGVIAGLAGTTSMATGNVLARRWGRPAGVGPLAFTGWQLAAGGLLLAPVALVVDGVPSSLSGSNLAGFAYLGVVNTSLAYALWFRGIGKVPVSSIAFLSLLSPITAAVAGWVVLDQHLGALQLVGVAVALGASAAGSLQATPPVSRPTIDPCPTPPPPDPNPSAATRCPGSVALPR
jgi:probable blue pigment (indigoidine) exporter